MIVLSLIELSILLSPWFSWTDSWLSDIGDSGGLAALLFNSAMVIGGAGGIVFLAGVLNLKVLKGRTGMLGAAALLIALVSLCGVGVFPSSTGDLHMYASGSFFGFSTISLVLFTVWFMTSGRKELGLFAAVLFLISVTGFMLVFADRPWGGNAVAEMMPSLSVSAFLIVFGYNVMKKPER